MMAKKMYSCALLLDHRQKALSNRRPAIALCASLAFQADTIRAQIKIRFRAGVQRLLPWKIYKNAPKLFENLPH
jgi:hypothetical protein